MERTRLDLIMPEGMDYWLGRESRYRGVTKQSLATRILMDWLNDNAPIPYSVAPKEEG